jgi:hypothetical protein
MNKTIQTDIWETENLQPITPDILQHHIIFQ